MKPTGPKKPMGLENTKDHKQKYVEMHALEVESAAEKFDAEKMAKHIIKENPEGSVKELAQELYSSALASPKLSECTKIIQKLKGAKATAGTKLEYIKKELVDLGYNPEDPQIAEIVHEVSEASEILTRPEITQLIEEHLSLKSLAQVATAISKQNAEILETINGTEVNSLKYEGCVGINGNKVMQEGKVIDTLDTDAKIKALWAEVLEEEGIASVTAAPSKHEHKIGDRVELTDEAIFDGTESGTPGTIRGLTKDDGVPTYDVEFDDGVREEQIYSDEIVKVLAAKDAKYEYTLGLSDDEETGLGDLAEDEDTAEKECHVAIKDMLKGKAKQIKVKYLKQEGHEEGNVLHKFELSGPADLIEKIKSMQ